MFPKLDSHIARLSNGLRSNFCVNLTLHDDALIYGVKRLKYSSRLRPEKLFANNQPNTYYRSRAKHVTRSRRNAMWNKIFFSTSATGGADSGPASLAGTPTDDKNGQQAFGAGEFRSIFFSDADIPVETPLQSGSSFALLHFLFAVLRD